MLKAIFGDMLCSVMPVSYTHLDVYKRQKEEGGEVFCLERPSKLAETWTLRK